MPSASPATEASQRGRYKRNSGHQQDARHQQVRAAAKEAHQEPEAEGDDEEEDEEYEIEEILDEAIGVFEDDPNGRAYYVKWKGYPPEDNQWVKESDAGNADQLIKEFRQRVKQAAKEAAAKKVVKDARGGSSTPAKRNAAAGPRKSNGGANDFSASATKRQRTSQVALVSSSQVGGGWGTKITEAQRRRDAQRLSKEAASGSLARVPGFKERGTTGIMVDGEEVPGSPSDEGVSVGEGELSPREREMRKRYKEMLYYESQGDWENLVNRIFAVEKLPSGTLAVFVEFINGESHAYENAVVNHRCPLKVIEFYESRLRFHDAAPSEDAKPGVPEAQGDTSKPSQGQVAPTSQTSDAGAADKQSREPGEEPNDVEMAEASEPTRPAPARGDLSNEEEGLPKVSEQIARAVRAQSDDDVVVLEGNPTSKPPEQLEQAKAQDGSAREAPPAAERADVSESSWPQPQEGPTEAARLPENPPSREAVPQSAASERPGELPQLQTLGHQEEARQKGDKESTQGGEQQQKLQLENVPPQPSDAPIPPTGQEPSVPGLSFVNALNQAASKVVPSSGAIAHAPMAQAPDATASAHLPAPMATAIGETTGAAATAAVEPILPPAPLNA